MSIEPGKLLSMMSMDVTKGMGPTIQSMGPTMQTTAPNMQSMGPPLHPMGPTLQTMVPNMQSHHQPNMMQVVSSEPRLMTPNIPTPTQPITRCCANHNCKTKANLSLCHCKSNLICSKECLRVLHAGSESYRLKCEAANESKKANQYKESSKLKLKEMHILEGNKKEIHRKDDGTFACSSDKNPLTVKTLNKIAINKGSKQKSLVKKHAKLYNKFKPNNKIVIKEVKPRGRGGFWYKSKDYDPLESQVEARRNPNQNQINVHQEYEEHRIDVENRHPDDLIQERKSSSKYYCGLCNQSIGAITDRLKCNHAGCKTHSSVHIKCCGLFPRDSSERKLIQGMYFCKSHTPSIQDIASRPLENPGQGSSDSIANKKDSTKPRVELSDSYRDVLSPYLGSVHIPENNVIYLSDYKTILKLYVEKRELKGADGNLHIHLDEELSRMIGESMGEKISYVMLKNKLVKKGHLTPVQEGQTDAVRVPTGVDSGATGDASLFPSSSQASFATPYAYKPPLAPQISPNDMEVSVEEDIRNYLEDRSFVLSEDGSTIQLDVPSISDNREVLIKMTYM